MTRDDVVAQAASAVDEPTRGDDPGTARRYVDALAGLPGVEHVVVVDGSGRRVLAEWGGPPGSADALLERARRATDPAHRGRRQLEDTVSTTASAFHLSRLVLAGAGQPESVWVALRVDRERGSLAWSTAALARLGGLPGATSAAPATTASPAAARPQAVPATSGAVVVPAVMVPAAPAVLPPPVPVAPEADVVPRARAASKARVALTTRSVPVPPAAPVVPEVPVVQEVLVVPGAPVVVEPAPETAEVALAGTATTVELVLPAPFVPAARPSPETDPEPPAPVTERRSSFAPVMVVLPPPSPVPDDGTTEEPAPMPAPIIIAPDPVADVPAPAAGPEPGATDEPAVVRRLIHGLRRRP